MKTKVYANKPKTLEELKDTISREMNALDSAMIANATSSVTKRARKLLEIDGLHFYHLN